MFDSLMVAEATQNTTLGTMIVVSGAFLLLMLLLKKFAWGAISDLLKQREEKIANDLDSAEQARIKAAKMEKERQEQLLSSKTQAADIVKNATESGNNSRQKILAEANQEVVALKEKAHQTISQEKEEALITLKDDVADLSIQIAEKILNKELTSDAHEALISSFIEGLGKTDEAR